MISYHFYIGFCIGAIIVFYDNFKTIQYLEVIPFAPPPGRPRGPAELLPTSTDQMATLSGLATKKLASRPLPQ